MLGTYFTFPELLIWIPLLAGIFCFMFKGKAARSLALASSVITLAVSCLSLYFSDLTKYPTYNAVNYIWLKQLGSSFYLGLDNSGHLLTFLTALSFPLIFLTTIRNEYKNPSAFFGLMMLAQAGLMGVFVAKDALVFYFFWELALIPVYFLCSKWGGERRIAATFKFFVYTFLGSLLMLLGIIFIYLHTPGRVFEDGTTAAHSFSMQAFYHASLGESNENWLFWLFFAAFAVKMPIFPFHTWQPETYDQAPTSVTMVLSGVMVKMGLLGVFRWLIPLLPVASSKYAHVVIILSIIGIIYASLIAMKQDNIKRLVAYSSIAHIGLMCASLFAMNELSVQGMMIQMFNHGINIIGLWVVVDLVEKKTGVKNISQLGGIAAKAPVLTWMMLIIALANIALPLTNGFVGEFMMFAGLYKLNLWYAVVAGVGIILAAVYTLNMVQKVFFGEVKGPSVSVSDIGWAEKTGLAVIIGLIFLFGVYPQPLIDLTKSTVESLLAK